MVAPPTRFASEGAIRGKGSGVKGAVLTLLRPERVVERSALESKEADGFKKRLLRKNRNSYR